MFIKKLHATLQGVASHCGTYALATRDVLKNQSTRMLQAATNQTHEHRWSVSMCNHTLAMRVEITNFAHLEAKLGFYLVQRKEPLQNYQKAFAGQPNTVARFWGCSEGSTSWVSSKNYAAQHPFCTHNWATLNNPAMLIKTVARPHVERLNNTAHFSGHGSKSSSPTGDAFITPARLVCEQK